MTKHEHSSNLGRELQIYSAFHFLFLCFVYICHLVFLQDHLLAVLLFWAVTVIPTTTTRTEDISTVYFAEEQSHGILDYLLDNEKHFVMPTINVELNFNF